MNSLALWLSIFLFVGTLIVSKNHLKSHKSAIIGAVVVFIYMFLSIFYIASDYFTGEGINDAVIYHLRYGLDGSGFGDYYLIMSVCVVLCIASLALSVFYYRLVKRSLLQHLTLPKRIIAIVAFLASWGIHPTVQFIAESSLELLGIDNPLSVQYKFSDYYREPELLSTSEEHPNLVYIFAESFEETYYDEKIFPNLVTKLRPIKEKSMSFSQIKQAQGTGWTIAGMTSVLCGIPLVTPTTNGDPLQGNSMSKMSSFYSGAVCLSDMLHKEGYKMVYRSGSPLEFAGVDKLYKTHQFDDIKGIKELKPSLQNPSYQTPWGLYDDTLFDISFNDFKKYSKNKQKFAMFISTMDTHHPYGHVSKSCQSQTYKDGSNSMLNAVTCSDELIAKFIQQIIDSPYGKNTIIVVGSDHLAMHNMAIDELNKGERRNQFMIYDPRENSGKQIDKVGTTLDNGVTVLSLLGYNAKLGLGRNLLTYEPSLQETFTHFNKMLNAWSKEISQFWEFPKLEEDLVLNKAKNSMKIGKTIYKFPILLRINDSLEVNPFFEVKIKFFETVKLFGYLQDFQADEPFLWVDTCARITKFEPLNENSGAKAKYCYAYGQLGSNIRVGALTENTVITLDTLKELVQNHTSDDAKEKQRKERLSSIQ